MFAIIQTSGRQYKVEKGTVLELDRIQGKEGDSLTLDKVLLVSDNTATKVGTPLVEGAFATAKILGHKQADKIIVFKMEAKKRYKRTHGHRQKLTTVEITDIKASGGSAKAESEPQAKVVAKKVTKRATPKKKTAKA